MIKSAILGHGEKEAFDSACADRDSRFPADERLHRCTRRRGITWPDTAGSRDSVDRETVREFSQGGISQKARVIFLR
jgi:hypothetical protein